MSEIATVVSTVVSALSGPAGAMVLLAVVLFGAWRLANRMLDVFTGHLTRIEAKFDTVSEKLEESSDKISDSLRSVALDIEAIKRYSDIRGPVAQYRPYVTPQQPPKEESGI
jgi:hypothetical protein